MCKISFNTFTFHNFLAVNVILYMYIYIYICILCIIYYIYKYIHKCILYIYIYISGYSWSTTHRLLKWNPAKARWAYSSPPPGFSRGIWSSYQFVVGCIFHGGLQSFYIKIKLKFSIFKFKIVCAYTTMVFILSWGFLIPYKKLAGVGFKQTHDLVLTMHPL